MTEKIKELAEKAGYHSDVFEMCRPGMEKFAELIVKECIDAIQTTDRRSLIYTSYDADNVEATIERVVRRVKERFDV